MSSKKRSSGIKRGTREGKQPGMDKSLPRTKSSSAADEEAPTVIDLDSDDPYKFVDSQSLLPDDHNDRGGGGGVSDTYLLAPAAQWAASSSSAKKTRLHSNAGGLSTPKRAGATPVAESITGSAKRKKTPKLRKVPTDDDDDWSQDELQSAIAASLQEKQREDRRNRLRVRETRVEEEEQLRLLREYQGMVTDEDSSDMEPLGPSDSKEMEEQRPEIEPGSPVSESLHPSNTAAEEPLSAVSAVSGTQLALKSVSVNKLSMKSLQANKRESKSMAAVDNTIAPSKEQDEDVSGCWDEVMIIDEEPTTKPASRSSRCSRSGPENKQSNTVESEVMKDIKEGLRGGDEDTPGDYSDDTPPISGLNQVTIGKVQAIVGEPLSRGTCKGPHSREAVGGEEERVDQDKTPTLSNKTRSTKTGLSLKKSRKRLSDTDSSTFQKVQSTSVQGPLAKRQKIQKTGESSRTSEAPSKTGGPGTQQLPGSREEAFVGREKHVKMAKISLTDIKKSRDVITKRVEPAVVINSVNLVKEDSGADTNKQVCGDIEVKENSSNVLRNGLATRSEAIICRTPKDQPESKYITRKESTALPRRVVHSRANNGFMMKRRASGWPLVKVRPSEKPRVPSLRAPPGVPPAEHTQVLVRCFDEYFEKLAMAQCKVLFRVKWGQPVVNVNKMAANSLNFGRRTKRSRTSNIPYSEYALDLKGLSSVAKSRSSSPMAPVDKRSSSRCSLSKSPGVSGRENFTPSGSDDDFVPPKSTEKRRERHREQKHVSSGKKRLSFTKERKDAVERTASKSPQGAKSSLSLSKKKSPQQRGRLSKSPKLPSLQFEREESPDIVVSNKVCEKRSESYFTSHSVTPPAAPTEGGRGHSATPTLQDDDVMMLDLTSPSPPPLGSPGRGQTHTAAGANEKKAILSGSRRERPQVHVTTSSHSHISRKADDSNNEEDLPPPDTAKLKTSHSSIDHDSDSFSEDDDQGHPHSSSTVPASSSSSWLNARKPPPVQSKSKRPTTTKRSKNTAPKSSASSKKKTATSGRGVKGKGKGSTKKPTSAAMRIKALIQMSGSDAEHSSEEESESATVGNKTTSSKCSLKSKSCGRPALESTDSDLSENEFDEHEGRHDAALPVSLLERESPGESSEEEEEEGKERRRLQRDRHTCKGVIDLTADTQIPPSHTPNSVLSSRSESPDDGRVSCPMCGKRFDSSVIQLHAEQCEGVESDQNDQWSEDITRYVTASSGKKRSASSNSRRGRGRGRGRGSLSVKKGGERGRQSYQPSLKQLVNKEKEISGEYDIDSGTTSEEQDNGPNDQRVNFGDFTAADRGEVDYNDTRLDWTEREELGGVSQGGYEADTLPEEGEGGFMRGSSVGSDGQFEAAVPLEDGEGGYIIDTSMISNSPIRSFKKLSELDPEERAGFDNQFKSKRARGKKGQRGREPMTDEERHSATWGRNDFSDLFDSSERSKGQRGQGGYRGRRYGWKNRWRGRGRGRGNSRGRCY